MGVEFNESWEYYVGDEEVEELLSDQSRTTMTWPHLGHDGSYRVASARGVDSFRSLKTGGRPETSLCLRPGCGGTFTARDEAQKYCSRRCFHVERSDGYWRGQPPCKPFVSHRELPAPAEPLKWLSGGVKDRCDCGKRLVSSGARTCPDCYRTLRKAGHPEKKTGKTRESSCEWCGVSFTAKLYWDSRGRPVYPRTCCKQHSAKLRRAEESDRPWERDKCKREP